MENSCNVYKTLKTVGSLSRYNSWIFNNIKPFLAGHVLDIGSGLGDVVQFFHTHPQVKSFHIADYSEKMIPDLEKRFSAHHDCSIHKIDISLPEDVANLPQASMNTITCINVLEHIEEDVKSLKHMHQLLTINGRVVILVPAFQSLYGTLDALVGHHRRYTKKTLGEKFKSCGFEIERQFYMNFLGTIIWFFGGRVFKQHEFNKRTCTNLDRFVPVLEMLERPIKPFFGQSLIMVGRKVS